MVGDREGFDPSSGSINESFVSPLAKQRAAVVESKPDFGSPKELELSNSLSNLKWGFRKRFSLHRFMVNYLSNACFTVSVFAAFAERKSCLRNLLPTRRRFMLYMEHTKS